MHWRSPVRFAIAALVVAGLTICVALGFFVIDDPPGRLPGVALGSELVLAVERAMALFAAWMLVVIVVARAISGELPSEISGRGVRYADAVATKYGLSDARSAIDDLVEEIDAMRRLVFELQAAVERNGRSR